MKVESKSPVKNGEELPEDKNTQNERSNQFSDQFNESSISPSKGTDGIVMVHRLGDFSEIKLDKEIDEALIDEPIEISLSGFMPNQESLLELTYLDSDNNLWKSTALFKVDKNGCIDLNKTGPIGGEYKKADSFGLFHLLKPEKNIGNSEINVDEMNFMLKAKVEGFDVFSKTITRKLKADDVIRTPINSDGVVGTIFSKNDGIKKPAVVVVPGAQGGIPETFSKLLASHGYVVLALGYFGFENLKESIDLIPLEYFQNAISFLKKYDNVDEKSIGFIGNSRAGELALLYGSLFPDDVDAFVSYVPSSVVYSSINFEGKKTSAWTKEGKPIEPFMNFGFSEMQSLMDRGKIPKCQGTYDDPINLSDFYKYKINEDNENFTKSSIDVEKIKKPLLVFSSGDDKIWPSGDHSDLIEEKLKQGPKRTFKHIKYENSGHLLGLQSVPYFSGMALPVKIGDSWYSHGGTVEGNAHAYKNSWKNLLIFLKNNLKKGSNEQ